MFLERADLIDGALAALLSSHHLLIIGPPGKAKSMGSSEIAGMITAVPSQIFGSQAFFSAAEPASRISCAANTPQEK